MPENLAHDPTPLLIGAFLDSAAVALECVRAEADSHFEVSVQQVTSEGLEQVEPEQVRGFFFARRVFRTRSLVGEITFGDRELEVNFTVGRVRSGNAISGQYGLWEWVAALGGTYPQARGDQFVLTVERLRAVVDSIGAVFCEYAPRIALAGTDVEVRLEAARARRQAEWNEEMRAEDHRRAASLAAAAFRARDYEGVVKLLNPFETRLTPAERKKLAMARKHL